MTSPILVVDDSLTVRMDLAEALRAEHMEVVLCASLAEARRALEDRSFRLVVLDVALPDGDGVTLLEEIRAAKAHAGTLVMLLSSEAEVRDRVRGIATGADEYVGKPYDRSYVVARARALLRSPSSEAQGEHAMVLIIDDSPTFREGLRDALLAADYAVLTASTGEDGLRAAEAERPDAIIVDGALPGIDGPTVIRRVRLDAALRGTPCILLTASEGEEVEIRALDSGADLFVRKAEDIHVVLARLAAVLRSAPRMDAHARPSSALGPKKILAVDDSEAYLQELAAELRAEGYQVVLASSGEDALDLLAVEPVDCILLDLMMPGIGGQETCRRIKSAPRISGTPLILLTALEDREAMLEGLGAGADDFISKSSDFQVLRARLRAQIRRKQFEDETRRIRERLLQGEIEAAEARAARELAETRAALLADVRRKNEELEAFSYSVSHDLRAPLRSIQGFSRILLEDHREQLDEEGREHLSRVVDAAEHMERLIRDLLELSRVTRAGLRRVAVNMAPIARAIVGRLRAADPSRDVEVLVEESLWVSADPGLVAVIFENLLGNAWKFTSKRPRARIEVGKTEDAEGAATYFVRDDGDGFDPAYASQLFGVFRRLHKASEFEGTGIGLATVRRIVDRHGGRVWGEGARGRGATFYFTLGDAPAH